jgi:Icc-related predicted phosphoesterase
LSRIFFTTDIHGSEKCWKKFINAAKFYGADILILGGDMTGKAIVPVIREGKNKFMVTFLEQRSVLDSEDKAQEMIQAIKNRGYYPVVMDPDEVADYVQKPQEIHRLFVAEALKSIEAWIGWAEERLAKMQVQCYVCPGNDDMLEIDEIIASSKYIQDAEGKAVPLNKNFEMVSTGWSNPTPWKTHRECPEEELEQRLKGMMAKVKDPAFTILNAHCPPYGLGLDEAPELDEELRPKYAGRSLIPVGSKAVRKVIEEYCPAAGLFGHIHEGKGMLRHGRTLCINPGSNYEQGILLGVLLELEEQKVGQYLLTTG